MHQQDQYYWNPNSDYVSTSEANSKLASKASRETSDQQSGHQIKHVHPHLHQHLIGKLPEERERYCNNIWSKVINEFN
jgi:hypothetical protein